MTIQHIVGILNSPRDAFRSTGQRFVAVALANHANEYGKCWPKVATIGREVGQSDGSVRRHIDTLIEDGWVEKLRRRRYADGKLGVWVYRVNLAKLSPPPDPEADDGVDEFDDEDDQRAPVSSGTPTSAHRCAGQRAPVEEPARTGARTGIIIETPPEPPQGKVPDVPSETPPSSTELVAPVKERNHAALDKLPKGVDPEDVKALCLHLRERMHQHHGGPGKATVTPNWVLEMGRLLNSGPKGVEGFVPTPGEVHLMIDAIFDRLHTPQGNSTFCWATVIQSPGNLREKWPRIAADLGRDRTASPEGMLAIMRQLDEMGVPRI
jgi:hypothetical protein